MIKYELHLCQSPACKEEALSFLNSLSLSAEARLGDARALARARASPRRGSVARRRTALCSPLPMDTNTRNGSGLGAFEGKNIEGGMEEEEDGLGRSMGYPGGEDGG